MKFICTTILAFLLSFLINSQLAIAGQINNSNQFNNDSIEDMENVKDNDKSTKIKKSEGDIFGDEQTFPFVAGLGKNAAH
tara:strand:- start:107 stop:346 length:240 start_codon:yes stop_codon:yes gene_type:complete